MRIIKLTGNILFLFIVVLVMCRCNEKDDEPVEQPDAPVPALTVSDISVVSGKHSLQVSWKAPESVSRLNYYLEWQGKNTDTTLYTATTSDTTYTITHLYNDEYTVRIMAVSKELQTSLPAEVVGRPEEDNAAPEKVGGLEVNPSASAVSITWAKPTAEDFEYVTVKVKKEGEEIWSVINTIQKTDSLIFIENLELETQYNYSIQAFDYNGNASEIVTGLFKTRVEFMLDKLDTGGNSLWQIADFSSEETRGDNGSAANAIDGKDNTFWYSVWNGGNFGEGVTTGALPQYIVIDLQNEVEPSAVLLYRRNANSAGPTLARIESTSGNPLTTKLWNDLGIYTLNGGTENGALPCNFRVIRKARYIKITILKAASGNYAQLREVDVKALVEENEEEY